MLLKSFPSITLSDNQWTNLNTLFGIPVGTALNVSNSGSNGCYIYINNLPPTSNTDGYLINRVADTTQSLNLSEGVETVWVKGENSRLNVNLTFSETPAPSGLYEGTRAMTTQNYTEANVKNGVQFEADIQLLNIASGAVIDLVILTGNLPVALKGAVQQFDEEGFSRTFYQNPVYTGGSPIPYYNKNYYNPSAGQLQILSGATVTSSGTQVSAERRFLGSNQGGNRTISTQSSVTFGLETVLAPDTVYLIRTTNLAPSSQSIITYVTWYEGELDLPRP